MLRKHISKITRQSSISVLDVELLQGGTQTFRLLTLKHKGNGISIADRNPSVASFDDLKKQLKGSPALAILVRGKGVLTRKTDTRLSSPSKQLSAVLPNAKLTEFYLQVIDGHETSFASIVRKTAIDPLLEQLHEIGIVVNLYLGELIAANLAQLLGDGNSLVINNTEFSFQAGQLAAWCASDETTPSVIQIGDENVERELLPAFAAGLQHFFRSLSCSLQNHSFENAQQELKQRQLFKVAGGIVLGVFFSALLINYLVFEDYKAFYNALETEVDIHRQTIQQVEDMRAELADKQQLLNSTGLMHQHSLAWYIDQVGQTVPDAIQLHSLDELPLQGKINKRKRLAFDQHSIVISGATRERAALNDWIKVLMEMEWTNGVEISHFSQPLNGIEGTFAIRLKL